MVRTGVNWIERYDVCACAFTYRLYLDTEQDINYNVNYFTVRNKNN